MTEPNPEVIYYPGDEMPNGTTVPPGEIVTVEQTWPTSKPPQEKEKLK